MRWGRKAFSDLRAFETLTLHTFPVGIREDLFSLMAHDFDAILEIRVERNAERIRHYLSIQKMRMTSIPQRMFELDTESTLLSVTTHEKIT
jgi:KaiC/GvpD/RAD55 family RecA-like ATPase